MTDGGKRHDETGIGMDINMPKIKEGEKETMYLSVAQAVDGIFEKFLHDVVKGASMNA